MTFLINFLTLAAVLVSCSETNFSGLNDSKKSGESNVELSLDPTPQPTQADPSPSQKQKPIMIENGYNIAEKCWFVVSGAHFGWPGDGAPYNIYVPSFPLPASGPIVHGAKFDTVGGVFLNTSDTPYEYGKGGREIDLAIDLSFDSIGVSPGVEVEIRESANGKVIYKGKGPYMANSSERTNQNLYHIETLLKSVSSKMPNWMKTYLESRPVPYRVDRIPLMSAKWVRVSKTPGVPCE